MEGRDVRLLFLGCHASHTRPCHPKKRRRTSLPSIVKNDLLVFRAGESSQRISPVIIATPRPADGLARPRATLGLVLRAGREAKEIARRANAKAAPTTLDTRDESCHERRRRRTTVRRATEAARVPGSGAHVVSRPKCGERQPRRVPRATVEMMRGAAGLTIGALMLSGCAEILYRPDLLALPGAPSLADLRMANSMLDGHAAAITLRNGQTIRGARSVRLADDGTLRIAETCARDAFIERCTPTPRGGESPPATVALSEVRALRVPRPGRGFTKGFLYGGLFGFVVAPPLTVLLVGAAFQCWGPCEGPVGPFLAYSAAAALLGGLIGGLASGAQGSSMDNTVITFGPDAPGAAPSVPVAAPLEPRAAPSAPVAPPLDRSSIARGEATPGREGVGQKGVAGGAVENADDVMAEPPLRASGMATIPATASAKLSAGDEPSSS
jgi:hypothetical protein